ncbi:MAG: hydroxymethylglutaryl-CoA synthase [Cognaticolwellia sp.]|jgi:hydroxymethylglutaryl-CoA synthase
MKKVGIDDMALYVPKIYFDIKDLAEARAIEYAKLNKGLGLSKMAIIDTHEDTATMAANAIVELIDKNDLNPNDIGRLYMGTESALDGAKPTATYALEMLRQKYAPKYGEDCFLHCDVIDMTFACIGAVDALQNTLDWASGNENRIGIVVSSDNAKYELDSTGEYTQGAGAVAMLVKQNPRLIALSDNWGVATRGVHDFYKPLRKVSKADIINEVLELIGAKNGSVQKYLDVLHDTLDVKGILDSNEETLTIHKDTPIFDGQYSNECYQTRITEAFEHFKSKVQSDDKESFVNTWKRLIFHLPYAFHGKRMFAEVYTKELNRIGQLDAILQNNSIETPNQADFETEKLYEKAVAYLYKSISKTPEYKAFVKEKIAKGQDVSGEIGNMYAGSIFLSLIGTLEGDYLDNSDIAGEKFGFFAYGSGSKSKVFEGEIMPTWKEVAAKLNITDKVNNRQAVDYATYKDLHTGSMETSFGKYQKEFVLADIGTQGVTQGARYYKWVD